MCQKRESNFYDFFGKPLTMQTKNSRINLLAAMSVFKIVAIADWPFLRKSSKKFSKIVCQLTQAGQARPS